MTAEPSGNDTLATVSQLKERVQAFCEARDWDPFHGAKDLAIGISTEAAELLEHFRFQSQDEVDRILRDPDRREEIGAELADVLIFLLRFAQRFDFDLATVVADKLEANERRYPVATSRGSNRKVRSST